MLQIQPIEELYTKQSSYKAVDKVLTEAEIEDFRQKFQGPTNFKWLLSPEPKQNNQCSFTNINESLFLKNVYVKTILSIHFKEDYAKNPQQALDNLLSCALAALTDDQILSIAQNTVGQASNSFWHELRSCRITGSIIGDFIRAEKRNSLCSTTFTKIVGSFNGEDKLAGVHAIQWGRTNEKTAISCFTANTGLAVETTGLWLLKGSMTGASPDGLIPAEDACIEVKCPFKYRKHMLTEVLNEKEKYIVFFDGTNWHINKQHNYFHQMQLEITCTNTHKCFLVLWTPKECLIFSIEKEEAWQANLDRINIFYKNAFLPKLITFLLNGGNIK
jgi:ectoine hydroxylase-related dioxygenase (phytanoyl-CoA dioxygenase family)